MSYSDLYKTPSVQQAQNIVESGGKDTSIIPKGKPISPVYEKVPVSSGGTVTKSIVDNTRNTLYKTPSVQQAEETVAKATNPPSAVSITPISEQAISNYKQVQTTSQPSQVPKNIVQQQQQQLSNTFGLNKPLPNTISGYTEYEKEAGFVKPLQPTKTEQLIFKSKESTSPIGKAGYYIGAVNRQVAEKNAEAIMDIPKHPIKNTAFVVGGTAFTILAPQVATGIFLGMATEEAVRTTGNTIENWNQNSYENVGLISQPIATVSQYYAQGKLFEFAGEVISSAPEGVPKMLGSKRALKGLSSARDRSGKTSKAQLRERKVQMNTFTQGNFQGIKLNKDTTIYFQNPKVVTTRKPVRELIVSKEYGQYNSQGEFVSKRNQIASVSPREAKVVSEPNIIIGRKAKGKTTYTEYNVGINKNERMTVKNTENFLSLEPNPQGSSKRIYSTQPIEQYKARQNRIGKEGIVVSQDTSIKGFNNYGKDVSQPYSSKGDFITSSGVVKTRNVEGFNKQNDIQTRGSAFDNQNKLTNQQYSELDYKYNYFKQGNKATKITTEPQYEGNIVSGKVTGGFRKGMKEKLYGKLYEKKAQLELQSQNQNVEIKTVQEIKTETKQITSQESELKNSPFMITRQSQGTESKLKQSNILGTRTAQKTEQGLTTETTQEVTTVQDTSTKTEQKLITPLGHATVQQTVLGTPQQTTVPDNKKTPSIIRPPNETPHEPRRTYTQRFTGWRQPTQPKEPTPKFKYGIMKSSKEKKQGFDVLVRRGGKFAKVNTGALSQEQAIGLGSYKVGTTAAATFKLQPSTSDVTESNVKGNLGDFYRKGELFIEKNVRRIKSWGEKQEITFKGIQANKSGFTKNKLKIFGR